MAQLPIDAENPSKFGSGQYGALQKVGEKEGLGHRPFSIGARPLKPEIPNPVMMRPTKLGPEMLENPWYVACCLGDSLPAKGRLNSSGRGMISSTGNKIVGFEAHRDRSSTEAPIGKMPTTCHPFTYIKGCRQITTTKKFSLLEGTSSLEFPIFCRSLKPSWSPS